jgi:hypothetical protein
MPSKIAGAILAVLLCHAAQGANPLAFHESKIVDRKQRQVHADLIFNHDTQSIVVRVADNNLAEVPYAAIDKLSYEFSKKHRVTEGAFVMVLWVPAGAVVMLTKSKSHWLYVDYKQDGVPKQLVVRLHKKEYRNALATARTETGKDVANILDAGTPKGK